MLDPGAPARRKVVTVARIACLISCLATPFGAVIAPGHAADLENGRELAHTHCSRCHVVPGRSSMSIGITPSFESMARYDNYYEAFSTFYALRPHPSFVRVEGIDPLNDLPSPIVPIEITLEDVEDIAEFARSIAETVQ